MKLGKMKLGFKRGQKGFTLVELMVVMAIMAVLAAIVFPAVSGTQEVSADSQTKQDASTVSNAISDFFADQTGAEIMTTTTVYILNASATARTSTSTGNTTAVQVTSSRWPELNLTDNATYNLVFPYSNNSTVANVVIKDGTTNITAKDLAEDYNAIDLDVLAGLATSDARNGNYIPAVPKSSTDLSGTSTRAYNNYLWLLEKTTASGGVSGGSRAVQVFKLVKVVHAESGGLDTLTYERIY